MSDVVYRVASPREDHWVPLDRLKFHKIVEGGTGTSTSMSMRTSTSTQDRAATFPEPGCIVSFPAGHFGAACAAGAACNTFLVIDVVRPDDPSGPSTSAASTALPGLGGRLRVRRVVAGTAATGTGKATSSASASLPRKRPLHGRRAPSPEARATTPSDAGEDGNEEEDDEDKEEEEEDEEEEDAEPDDEGRYEGRLGSDDDDEEDVNADADADADEDDDDAGMVEEI